jgi:hypothetical protein
VLASKDKLILTRGLARSKLLRLACTAAQEAEIALGRKEIGMKRTVLLISLIRVHEELAFRQMASQELHLAEFSDPDTHSALIHRPQYLIVDSLLRMK